MQLSAAFRALRHPLFRRFFAGQTVSLVGFWLQTVALSWLVWRTTRSPVMLAVVAFAGSIPMLVISPFAGALIDRFDRRRALITTQVVQMVQAGTLAALAFADYTPIELIVPLALMGWGNGLNMPNAMANALSAVPASRVGAASALMGFVQMVTAAVLTLLVGYVPHDTQMNIGIGVAVTGIVGLIGWWTLVRRPPSPGDGGASTRSNQTT